MFDPYHKWLAIPRDRRPPTFYDLLSIAPTEDDPEVIDAAAIRQTTYVRNFQRGPHAADCARILGEIALARATLLDAKKRRDYDATLPRPGVSARPSSRSRSRRPAMLGTAALPILVLAAGFAMFRSGPWRGRPRAVGGDAARVEAPKAPRSGPRGGVVAKASEPERPAQGPPRSPAKAQAGSRRRSAAGPEARPSRVVADSNRPHSKPGDGGPFVAQREFSWATGKPAVRLLPADEGIGVLTAVGGMFEGLGERVRVSVDRDGLWSLDGACVQQVDVRARAVALRGRRPFWGSPSAFEWAAGGPPVRMIARDEGLCVLAGLSGRFLGGAESVRVWLGPDGFWYLQGRSAGIPVAATALAIPIEDPRWRDAEIEEHVWRSGGPPIRMLRKEEGFCFLSGIGGGLRGGGDLVQLYDGDDGYVYLGGRSAQPLLFAHAISVRLPRPRRGTPAAREPVDEKATTNDAPVPRVDPPPGASIVDRATSPQAADAGRRPEGVVPGDGGAALARPADKNESPRREDRSDDSHTYTREHRGGGLIRPEKGEAAPEPEKREGKQAVRGPAPTGLMIDSGDFAHGIIDKPAQASSTATGPHSREIAAEKAPAEPPYVVAHWRFEEGRPDTPATGERSILDSSGHGLHGTPVNGPVSRLLAKDGEPPWAGGRGKRVLDFNGMDQRIFIADDPRLRLTDSLTIEAVIYVRRQRTKHEKLVVFRGDDRIGLDPYILILHPNGDLGFGVSDAANTGIEVKHPIPGFNRWFHVAGTLDGNSGTLRLYFDGKLVESTTTRIRPFGPLDASRRPGVAIGSMQASSPDAAFEGMLAEVRLSDRALDRGQFLNRFFEGRAVASDEEVKLWGHLDIADAAVEEGFLHLERGKSIATRAPYSGPIDVYAVARTTGRNIRVNAFNGAGVILNWEVNPSELRVHRPDGNEGPFSGSVATAAMRPLRPWRWYKLHWRVTRESILVSIDGKTVFKEKVKLKLDHSSKVSIFSYDDPIDVQNFVVNAIK